MSFRRNLPKSRQNRVKFVKKDVKKNKNSPFFVRQISVIWIAIRRRKSNVATLMVEVRQACQSDIPIAVTQSNSFRTIGILQGLPTSDAYAQLCVIVSLLLTPLMCGSNTHIQMSSLYFIFIFFVLYNCIACIRLYQIGPHQVQQRWRSRAQTHNEEGSRIFYFQHASGVWVLSASFDLF